MELEVTPAFPTLIGRLQIPDAGAMNRDLQTLILAEEAQYSSLGRSNIGGWQKGVHLTLRLGIRKSRESVVIAGDKFREQKILFAVCCNRDCRKLRRRTPNGSTSGVS